MRCEGRDCKTTFRDGDTAYAHPTRVIIVRGGTVRYSVVDRILCTACNAIAGFPSRADVEKRATSKSV